MSDQREAKRSSGVEVARVGGGNSARIGAMVVAVALVAVAWVGVSGRPPQLSTATPQLAVHGEAATGPGAAEPTFTPRAAATHSPRPTTRPDTYGVSATIGSNRLVAVLDELRPGYLFSQLRVPYPPEAQEGTLAITQLWANDFAESPIAISSWDLPLRPLTSVSRETDVVLDVDVPGRPRMLNVPPPVRSGYHLTVYAENDLLFSLLSVEVTMGPRPGITGDDGIFGWPTIANLPK